MSGKTFTSGQLISDTGATQAIYKTGSMVNKAGLTVDATNVTESADKTKAVISIPAVAYYDTNSKISVPIETIKNNVKSLNITYEELVSMGSIKTASQSVSVRYNEGNSGAGGSVSFPSLKKVIGVVGVSNEHYERIIGVTGISENTVYYKQGYSKYGSDEWRTSTITVIGY